eukprot:CAMPEP_0118801176 /NCGR_PEP_ID=MMETSP1161-20130426/2821_1 /TAXON_ID=249345 /ORGANISM="Picochlorum oklahomensis, Strain CCMP2329" /LENGTH=393 /DNA_ID=CAMNT_0006729079 /DNA_START=293 /DNA_END=1474 /DNA_ORIENTATION=-
MAEHNPKDTTGNEEITPEYNDNVKQKSQAVPDGEPGPSRAAARTTRTAREGRMPPAFHVHDDGNSEEEVDQICVEMASDLGFSDTQLEKTFQRMYMESQRKLDVQFHIARSMAWAAVGIRMLSDMSNRFLSHYIQSGIVLFGAVTTLFPGYAYQLFRNVEYHRYRPVVVMLDNVLQVVLGCFTHDQIYPEPQDIASWRYASPFRAVAVFVTGSGVAWLNMSALLGSLTFRFAWIQQILLVAIMMLSSPEMCSRSYSLQKAHIHVMARIVNLLKRIMGANQASSIVGEDHVAVQAWTCVYGEEKSACELDAEHACLVGQSGVLLLAGFIFPTLYLFAQELTMRKRFLQQNFQYSPHQKIVLTPVEPGLLHYAAFAVPTVAMLYFYWTNFSSSHH